jgi:ubiquinone/menaquinone biosynthesis C-methylase UbiE
VLDPAIADYYGLGAEESRLFADGRPRLEYVRTLELLERFLPPPPASVLDVGGGTGVYSTVLAERGYIVELVDLVPAHVERAGQIAAERGLSASLTARVGDARDLDARDGSHDAVLMLGPLYHLVDRHDRAKAWGEAVRVTRPGGVVVAVGISRFASLLDGLKRRMLTDPVFRSVVEEDLRSGQHRNPDPAGLPMLFTTAFFHLPEELEAEAREAGLTRVALLAVEGPGWIVEDVADMASLSDAARAVEAERALVAASAHMIVVGWAS